MTRSGASRPPATAARRRLIDQSGATEKRVSFCVDPLLETGWSIFSKILCPPLAEVPVGLRPAARVILPHPDGAPRSSCERVSRQGAGQEPLAGQASRNHHPPDVFDKAEGTGWARLTTGMRRERR